MISRRSLLLVCSLAILGASPSAREKDEAAQTELRTVREAMTRALDKGDIDGLLAHVAPDIVVTGQNGKTVRGVQALRTLAERLFRGGVRRLTSQVTVDGSPTFYKDRSLAVVVGSMDNHAVLQDGMSFDLDSRWTATLMHEGGKWKIVAFHISANTFDNGVQDMAVRKARLKTGLIVGIAGLILGAVVGFLVGRRRAA